jgi:hypothetical protein
VVCGGSISEDVLSAVPHHHRTHQSRRPKELRQLPLASIWWSRSPTFCVRIISHLSGRCHHIHPRRTCIWHVFILLAFFCRCSSAKQQFADCSNNLKPQNFNFEAWRIPPLSGFARAAPDTSLPSVSVTTKSRFGTKYCMFVYLLATKRLA